MIALAAIARAERHHPVEPGPVGIAWVHEHLHVAKQTKAAREVREQVAALVEAGLVERTKRNGGAALVLTDAGRRRLRRAGEIELPESPQHAKWRQKRALAADRIEQPHLDARSAVEETDDFCSTGSSASHQRSRHGKRGSRPRSACPTRSA